MKRVLFSILTLVGFSIASFAQTTPAVKKTEPAKIQAVKKTTDKKIDEKTATINKTSQPAVPAGTKKAVTTTATTKTAGAVPLKKNGTPDKRYKASQATTAGPVKKDGTPDLRYKANKKHS